MRKLYNITKSFVIIFTLFFFADVSYAQHRGLFIPGSKGSFVKATEEKRIALLVGNTNYVRWADLEGPAYDIDLLAPILRGQGFEVITAKDVNKVQFESKLYEFSDKISKGGTQVVSLFYYAGHGMMNSAGINHLIPVDDNSECEYHLSLKSISLDVVQSQMQRAAMKILIVDACRNTLLPFTCPAVNKSALNSVFNEYAPKGTFTVFSTAPGRTALDLKPNSKYSPFADALAKALVIPGLTIESVFKLVTTELDSLKQEAWFRPNFSGEFYFIAPKEVPEREKIVIAGDQDGDGLADKIDRCPDEYGSIDNGGCPVRTKTNREKIASGEAEITEKIGNYIMTLRRIIGGSFTMGSSDSDAESNEYPHTVRVSDFYLSRYEVTVGEYLEFCNATNSHWPGWLEKGNSCNVETGTSDFYKKLGYRRSGSESLPVVGVSWYDAEAYAVWLSQKTGLTYRLPTEAEWEYSARGGQNYKYSGSEDIDRVGNYGKSGKDNKPQAVGMLSGNGYGLYDMSGNVWEWCSDWYDGEYYKKSGSIDPENTTKSDYKVLRGGSWNGNPANCRVAYRDWGGPSSRDYSGSGFRLVLSR